MSSRFAGRRPSIAPAIERRLFESRSSAPRRSSSTELDDVVERALGGRAAALGRAERGLHGALDRLAERVGELLGLAGARRHRSRDYPLPSILRRPVTAVHVTHLRPAAELAERVLLPGDPHRALAVAQALLDGRQDVQPQPRALGLHRRRRRRRAAHGPVDRHGRPERRDRLRGADRARARAGWCGSGPARRSATSLALGHAGRGRRRCSPLDGASAALGAGGSLEPGSRAARASSSRPALRPATVASTDLFYDRARGRDRAGRASRSSSRRPPSSAWRRAHGLPAAVRARRWPQGGDERRRAPRRRALEELGLRLGEAGYAALRSR